MSTETNCAFQYAKMNGSFLRTTKIVCDQSGLTLDQAKELWNKYYPDAAKHIKDEVTVEMVIWANMPDDYSYSEHLEYISTDAESDGITIWEVQKKYFTKQFKISQQTDNPCQ